MTTHVSFEDWTRGRAIPHWGTNVGAPELPFQGWRRFKEAFAPEVVERAIRESRRPVESCLDPFGGSGTTALACQFIGVLPVAIEVNPYLADLIEAKLVTYDPDALATDLRRVIGLACSIEAPDAVWGTLPTSFLEPGDGNRWLFDQPVARRIAALLNAINKLENPKHRLLFRVILGGVLVDVSNVVVSGKGRRYRRRWETRRRAPESVLPLFTNAAQMAIRDVNAFGLRRQLRYQVIRGDSRALVSGVSPTDLAVFSPPYPNSFDYTDVYNIELWILGYLTNATENRSLRLATLSSHVQIARDFGVAPAGSLTLDRALDRLGAERERLWSPWIPEMIGAYFADLVSVLRQLHTVLREDGSVWLVVGDSRYAGVHVPAAEIVAELAPRAGFGLRHVEPSRSMRASAQQGGQAELVETLLVLDRIDHLSS